MTGDLGFLIPCNSLKAEGGISVTVGSPIAQKAGLKANKTANRILLAENPSIVLQTLYN